jgi:hypothetical protein
MPTDAEKKAIADAARKRAAEQAAAVEAKQAQVEEFRQDAAEKQAGGRAVTPMPVTEAHGDAVEEYGPYDDRKVVPTSQGENAVPYKKVLFFQPVEEFNARAQRMEIAMKPFYRNATPEEMAPILARRAKRKALLAKGGV